MLKFPWLTGTCVLFALTTGCGGGEKAEKGDKVKIVGNWVLEGMESGGISIPGDMTKERKLVMTADKMIHEGRDDPIRSFFLPPRKDDPISYTLDPSKSPKHIDMWINKDKEEAMKGIYSLE